MDQTSWTAVAAVATALLALGTAALAGGTVWVHRREETERRCTAFRSALAALLDACRTWASFDPAATPDSARRLTADPLRLDAVDQFVSQVTIPPQVLARLLWQLSQAKLEAAATAAEIPQIFLDGSIISPKSPAQVEAEGQARWHRRLTLDHLQVAACLIRAEAKRRRFADLAEVFERRPLACAATRPAARRARRSDQPPSLGCATVSLGFGLRQLLAGGPASASGRTGAARSGAGCGRGFPASRAVASVLGSSVICPCVPGPVVGDGGPPAKKQGEWR